MVVWSGEATRRQTAGADLMQKAAGANATVPSVCRVAILRRSRAQGDIVVVAIGQARFLTADMVRPGAVVVDVGMNRRPDESSAAMWTTRRSSQVASAITPVPGGVGR